MEEFFKEYVLTPYLWRKFAALRAKRSGGSDQTAMAGPDEALVSGERWDVFLSVAHSCQKYVEFGVGSSTLFMAAHTDSRIVSVETDPKWAKVVIRKAPRPITIKTIDLGLVGDWGRPRSYDKSSNIRSYLESGFDGVSPDLVLVDGRFRVASFCSALLHSEPGGYIVFDDYPQRPHYQIVERLTQPILVSEHQALFQVPQIVDTSRVKSLLDSLYHVMD